MIQFRFIPQVVFVMLTVLLSYHLAAAQTTAFTYQGKLTDAGAPASGNYDLQFKLFDSLSAGTQQGATVTNVTVVVNAGIFTVTLDFGANVFSGANRWLEISVRPAGSLNAYTVLSPRQPITSTPYSIQTLKAASADALSNACVGCVQDAQINAVAGSKVTGTIPVAGVPAGSANYIQNATAAQAASNFNISGNGTAGGTLSGNAINSATNYQIGGSRALGLTGGIAAYSNTFVGNFAGAVTTPSNTDFSGNSNSFFGSYAGAANTTGGDNSFYGRLAGTANTMGSGNSFFGQAAGNSNSGGNGNSIFGEYAGTANGAGNNNSIFGSGAGGNNVNGSANTFIGASAGSPSDVNNATAIGANASVTQNNSLVLGSIAGINGAAISTNVGIGTTAPQASFNVNGASWFQGGTGQLPAAAGKGVSIGYSSNFDLGAIFAYDYGAGAPKNLALNSTGGNVGIGSVAPADRLTVQTATSSYGLTHTDGTITVGSFIGSSGGWLGTKSNHPLYFFANGGNALMTVAPSGNVGVGTITPQASFNVNGASWFQGGTGQLPAAAGKGVSVGYSSNFDLGAIFAYDYGAGAPKNLALNSTGGNVGIGSVAPADKLTVQTASGNYGFTHTDGTIVVGSYVGGGGGGGWYGTKSNHALHFFTNNSSPQITLATSGNVGIGLSETNPRDVLEVNGIARILAYGAAGSIPVCVNALLQLSSCSSSLRYKTDLRAFDGGLALINKLSPLTFRWKADGSRDLGFGAEDVAKIEPLLVTHNKDGEIEGVKYDRFSVVFVNAFKEQQAQIEAQQNQISDLKNRIELMKQLICADHPQSKLCQSGENK